MTKYSEIMEHISVDETMENRILNALQETDPNKQSNSISNKNKSKKNILHIVPLAACFMLLIIGAPLLKNLTEQNTLSSNTQAVPDFVDCSNTAELSETLGFTINEPSLPFTPEASETTYTASWHTTAEIRYTGEGQTALYRESEGTEDNSGDYNAYSDVITFDLDKKSVTLKGENGSYVLAIWNDGSYSYSLSLSNPISKEAWCELIKEN